MGSESGNEAARQYLVFNLAGELFALRINHVKEVLQVSTLTKIPRVPCFMRGVINLRGTVSPVIDLRMKFGMDGAKQTVNTCIIIVEVSFDGEKAILGAMVDEVEAVLTLDGDQIEPLPKMGTDVDIRFIIILDSAAVFSSDEIVEIQGMDPHAAQLEVAASCQPL